MQNYTDFCALNNWRFNKEWRRFCFYSTSRSAYLKLKIKSLSFKLKRISKRKRSSRLSGLNEKLSTHCRNMTTTHLSLRILSGIAYLPKDYSHFHWSDNCFPEKCCFFLADTAEETLLKQALNMSKPESAEPQVVDRDFSSMTEEEQIAYAMQLSMQPLAAG